MKRKRTMLIFDTAYTYKMMVERNFLVAVTSRDLEGYFDHIWTIHPVASLFLAADDPNRYGDPTIYKVNDRHTVIEAKIGRTAKLAWLPPLNFLWAQVHLFFWLLKHSKKHDISFFRSEDPYYNGLLAYLLAKWFGRPLIIGVWGNPGNIRKTTKQPLMPRLKKIWIEEIIEKFILHRADKVLVQNEDNKRFVLSCGVADDNVVIFRLSTIIDVMHFTPPDQRFSDKMELKMLGINNEFIVGCISRLNEVKLVDHFIKAINLLKIEGWNVKGLVVGDGSFEAALRKLTNELGLENQIIFCGNRDQNWLYRNLPLLDVVVAPLTGRALAEAALASAPIVAYDIDWHSELIETNSTGELVPYLNYQEMAKSIAKILNDKEYSSKLRDNVRHRILELMDLERNMKFQKDTYEDLWQTLIKKR